MSSTGRPEDRPTIGERYGSATVSSNLRMGERRGDADYLIAAGWLPNNMGKLLFRLAHEFDCAKGDHGIAEAEFVRMERLAARLDADKSARAPISQREAADIRRAAAQQALTSRTMIFVHLKSLRETRQALDCFAWLKVQRRGLEWPADVVAKLVGQVIELHLDRTCHNCQGRGRNGGYGAPMSICRECAGLGLRDERKVGKDALQRDFGAWLLGEMRRMMGQAGAGIVRALAPGASAAGQTRAGTEALIADELEALRSREAGSD